MTNIQVEGFLSFEMANRTQITVALNKNDQTIFVNKPNFLPLVDWEIKTKFLFSQIRGDYWSKLSQPSIGLYRI